MSSKVIAVSGATGQQGGSVALELRNAGYKVRALTRKLDSPAAKALAKSGAEVIQTEFTNSASLESALTGVDAFFLVTTPFESGTELEIDQGIAAVDAAVKARVPYIVFSSVSDANTKTGVPHFDSKYEIEKHLSTSGIPFSVIAPVFFYENMLAPFVIPGLKEGAFAQAMPEDSKLQMVSLRTIGSVAALALVNRERFEGKRINLAGDNLSGKDVAKILGDAIGKPLMYSEVPLEAVMSQSEDMGLMYKWFTDVGYSADIDGLKAAYPEADWVSFKEWAESVDWAAVL